MTVGGSGRGGKCEMRGVPGGAGMSENSAAREVRSVCVGERTRSRLVDLERREMSDWGVMSSAYSI